MREEQLCCESVKPFERKTIDFDRVINFINSIPNKELVESFSITTYGININYIN